MRPIRARHPAQRLAAVDVFLKTNHLGIWTSLRKLRARWLKTIWYPLMKLSQISTHANKIQNDLRLGNKNNRIMGPRNEIEMDTGWLLLLTKLQRTQKWQAPAKDSTNSKLQAFFEIVQISARSPCRALQAW